MQLFGYQLGLNKTVFKSVQNLKLSHVLFPISKTLFFFAFFFSHVSCQLVVSSDFWSLDWSSLCSCPLLIFINSKSGDHQGIVFLQKLSNTLTHSKSLTYLRVDMKQGKHWVRDNWVYRRDSCLCRF